MSTSLKCWIGSKSYVWSMNRVASGMNDGRFGSQPKLPEFNWDPAAWLTTKMGLVRWWHGKWWVGYGGMVHMIIHSSILMYYCRYSAWKKNTCDFFIFHFQFQQSHFPCCLPHMKHCVVFLSFSPRSQVKWSPTWHQTLDTGIEHATSSLSFWKLNLEPLELRITSDDPFK